MLMELRGYNQDTEYNYRVFYDDLRIEIQLPSCVINGKTYYMEFEKLAPYDSSASLRYRTTIVEDKENGKLTIFHDNIYRTGYYPIGRVFLKFPQIAGLDKGKYTFTGAMRWYNGDTEITHIKNETIDGKVVPRTTFSIVMDNAQAAELDYYSHDKTIGCCDHVAQMFLGNYTLVNKGSKASEKVTVQMTFNASGTARLGVASVMLMGDPNQRPMTVRCTLMDETGKVIDNNGQPFTVEVPHNYTTYAATVNHGVLFNRGMLPAEYQKYYFKSVEYDISSIPAGHNYNSQADSVGLQKPGNFYGYYLGEHNTSGKTSNTICKVFDVNGDEKASLTDTVVTNVIERYRASMYINCCGFYKTEINAGSGFTERMIFVVDFSGADAYLAENAYTVRMTVKGNGVADAVSKELQFTTTGIRTFSASADKTALNYGEDFTVTYTVGNASNDSKYDGRMLALVVDGGSLPTDARLIAGGTTYYQNSRGQFIVPLTGAQTADAKSISMRLESDILVNNLQSCTLTADLWISATANGAQPQKGSVADSVTVTYTAVTPPSLKVNAMSDRALNPEDLANSVSLTYSTANIPSGGSL